jgi:hypothetical protein
VDKWEIIIEIWPKNLKGRESFDTAPWRKQTGMDWIQLAQNGISVDDNEPEI